MRVFVRCDKRGALLAVAKASIIAEGLEHPFADLGEDESVIELEETPELQALAPHEISEQYRADMKRKKLRKR